MLLIQLCFISTCANETFQPLKGDNSLHMYVHIFCIINLKIVITARAIDLQFVNLLKGRFFSAALIKKYCNILHQYIFFQEQELADFPLNSKLVAFFRQRITLATELESLEYRLSKDNAQKSWKKRAAAEADLVEEDDRQCIQITIMYV